MKIIMTILLLAILGAAGYFGYQYFKSDGSLPFMEPAWPEELIELQEPVGLEVSQKGYALITANTRSDLLFTQGLVHGRQAGEQLDTLRRLFRGERAETLPRFLGGLAELFFYLDLDHTAQASRELYPAQLQVLLQAYADGITQGSGLEEPWTLEDVLLYHRGIAFLQGRNFVKEWSAYQFTLKFGQAIVDTSVNYVEADFGALGDGIGLQSTLNALHQKPLFETVRLYNGKDLIGAQTRTHPFFKFIYTPMILDLNGSFKARGISITGIPFLQAGKNGHLTYFRQTVLGNNEQFQAAPQTSFMEQEPGYFSNDNAKNRGDYNEPPVHTRLGRKVSSLVGGGKKNTDYYYHWDGLRPSADLASLYYLLEARDPDEALSAYQYHQVPATELTVLTKQGHTVNALVNSSDAISGQGMDRRLFSGPVTRIGQQLHAVKSSHNQSDRSWQISKADKIGVSELDRRLAALMSFYLKGPIRDEHVSPELQDQLLVLLESEGSIDRDLFIHKMWEVTNRLLAQEYFANESGEQALRIMSQEAKQVFLSIYGRRGPNANRQRDNNETRAKVIAGLLKMAYGKDDTRESTWLVENAKGKARKKKVDFPTPSSDASTGLFFVEQGNRVTQVSTYTFAWGKGFQYWRYAYVKEDKIGRPKRVTKPGATDKMITIQPKI